MIFSLKWIKHLELNIQIIIKYKFYDGIKKSVKILREFSDESNNVNNNKIKIERENVLTA